MSFLCILLEGIGPTIFIVLKAATSRGFLARIGKESRILHSVADPDPGTGAFFTTGSGMDKKIRIRD
jgi:hypothetical protein